MSFGVGASHSESESSSSKSSSSEVQRGFPEAQSKFLSEFFEPKLREYAIPYAESRFLGKPITRTTTVPGTPAMAGIQQIGAPRRVPIPSLDYAPPGAQIEVEGNFDEPKRYFQILPGEPEIVGAKAAVPESTKTDIVGFEEPLRTYPRLGQGGLFDEQRSGAVNLGNYAQSRLGGIPSASIGESGLIAAAPGLFDLIGQQVEKDVLKPEEQRQLNVLDLLAAIKLGVQGVGGSGSSVGQSFGTSSNSNWGFRVSGGKPGEQGGTSGGYGV